MGAPHTSVANPLAVPVFAPVMRICQLALPFDFWKVSALPLRSASGRLPAEWYDA